MTDSLSHSLHIHSIYCKPSARAGPAGRSSHVRSPDLRAPYDMSRKQPHTDSDTTRQRGAHAGQTRDITGGTRSSPCELRSRPTELRPRSDSTRTLIRSPRRLLSRSCAVRPAAFVASPRRSFLLLASWCRSPPSAASVHGGLPRLLVPVTALRRLST